MKDVYRNGVVTTVTLNAALDKVYTVPQYTLDRVHRIGSAVTVPGGKGINAARVLRALSVPVRVAGFVAGHTGRQLLDLLQAEGIAADTIAAAAGETRLAITVLDPVASTQTELIEAGPCIAGDELAAMRRKVETLARDSAWVVFSGSLPEGCPPCTYAELIQLAKAQGARTALDASGAALAAGLAGGPDLVKPNADEAAQFAGMPVASPDTAMVAASILVQAGAGLAVVSLGAEGALAATREAVYRITIPNVRIVSPLGSGDAMVAGLVAASLQHEGDLPAILKHGAACGTAAALHKMAGVVTPADVEALERQIEVQLISS